MGSVIVSELGTYPTNVVIRDKQEMNLIEEGTGRYI